MDEKSEKDSVCSRRKLSTSSKKLSEIDLDLDAHSSPRLTNTIQESPDIEGVISKCKDPAELITYKIRWAVLFSVCFLNISNGSIWLNYFPAANHVANYFETTPEKINWFSICFMIVSIPGCFIGPYCSHRFGLRTVIWLGCGFNFIGATIRMIATSGLISDLNTQYDVGMCGQVLAAVGQNFLLYLHTKVSQTWFPENQRGIATTFLAIADPVGVLITELTVPRVINSKEDVPFNDKIWFGIAALTVVTTVLFVRRSKPKTPPSRSAAERVSPPYLQQLRTAFTTVPFLFLLLSLGGGVAFTIAFQTVTQEILCPLGYSNEFGGLINAIMLLFGFAGSAVAGHVLDKTKKYTELTMYLFGIASIIGIILFELLMYPNKEVGIAIMAALFGLFGVSIFPVGLELAVETTYPVEETMTTALVFLSGQILAVIIIIIVPAFAFDKADPTLSVCDLESGGPAKDYTISLMVVMAFLVVTCCSSLLFFKTEYKRQNAENASRALEQFDEKTNSHSDEAKLRRSITWSD